MGMLTSLDSDVILHTDKEWVKMKDVVSMLKGNTKIHDKHLLPDLGAAPSLVIW